MKFVKDTDPAALKCELIDLASVLTAAYEGDVFPAATEAPVLNGLMSQFSVTAQGGIDFGDTQNVRAAEHLLLPNTRARINVMEQDGRGDQVRSIVPLELRMAIERDSLQNPFNALNTLLSGKVKAPEGAGRANVIAFTRPPAPKG